MAGTVTTEPAGATDWSYAQVNRPLTTGDQLWNDKGARSELHIGSTAVRLGESTNLDVLNLDDDSTQLKVAQGTLSTRVRELPAGGAYEIDTPNLALGIGAPGDYRVDVAPDGSETTVTVRSGSATVYGDGGQVPIAAGQQIRFSGTNLQQVAANGAPAPDALDQWAASRDAAEDSSLSARYVSRDVPGYQDLDANGTWRQDPQYGAVWTPNQVPAGWAPYQDGHWVWQAPWGWTWVDDAPWGFAPYHYGRWAYIGNSWAWVPGEIVSEPPVYAPALVAFVGDGGGGVDYGVSLAVGGVATAGLAWFALGPGEPWHPHWGGHGHDWSPHYYDRVNRPIYGHNHNFHNTYVNYHAPHAVTCVPATAFVHGQPVNRFAQKVDPRQWHNARFSAGAPGIAPVRQSFGPGLRNAAYRPPATAMARPVVATRRPDVPPAYRDQLAQRFARGGGRVPGAGSPVVHATVPANFGGRRIGDAGGAQPNVRLVAARGPGSAQHAPMGLQQRPGMPPQAAIANGGQRGEPRGEPGRQPNGHPNGQPFGQINGQPNGVPHSQPFAAGAPSQGRPPMPGQAGAGAQQPNAQATRPGNGVPRPPQFAGGNAVNHAGTQWGNQQPGSHGQPSWTQPHTPLAQQRGEPSGGRPGQQPFAQGGRPPQMQGQPQGQPQAQAYAHPQQRPDFNSQANVPRAQAQGQGQGQAQQHAPRPDFRPPQAQQAVQQPRQEFHPQPVQQPGPQQPVQHPRQEFHPQQVQQPRPQPVQQPRPQQVQQQRPRPQPVQQPRPQPQPHQEQRTTGGGGGHDDHRHG